jgi:hypothetical protein
VPARAIKKGDKLAVLSKENDPAAGFSAAVVTGVDTVETAGFYTPALESPYIIADGVPTPL